MTSIEFIVKELKLEGYDHTIQQTKEMHKQEIMDGFNQGYREGWIDSISGDCTNDQDVETFEDANLYYQETFVSKGSGAIGSPIGGAIGGAVELPQQDVDKLGNEDVPKLGYDVEKLAYDYASKELNRPIEIYKVLEANVAEYKSFINGYLKAKETLYTEEQVIGFAEHCFNMELDKFFTPRKILLQEYIQSLKQPKKD